MRKAQEADDDRPTPETHGEHDTAGPEPETDFFSDEDNEENVPGYDKAYFSKFIHAESTITVASLLLMVACYATSFGSCAAGTKYLFELVVACMPPSKVLPSGGCAYRLYLRYFGQLKPIAERHIYCKHCNAYYGKEERDICSNCQKDTDFL